jgi:hypothetical protein
MLKKKKKEKKKKKLHLIREMSMVTKQYEPQSSF